MSDSKERFFILTPTATDRTAVASPEQPERKLPVYLDASGMEMKWSGAMTLPAIGDRVYIRMNSIGWGQVKGYAESHGFLGLLVLPENPPDWYKRQMREQNKAHKLAQRLGPEKAQIERVRLYPKWILEGIACVFGVEISLTK